MSALSSLEFVRMAASVSTLLEVIHASVLLDGQDRTAQKVQ